MGPGGRAGPRWLAFSSTSLGLTRSIGFFADPPRARTGTRERIRGLFVLLLAGPVCDHTADQVEGFRVGRPVNASCESTDSAAGLLVLLVLLLLLRADESVERVTNLFFLSLFFFYLRAVARTETTPVSF
ncbi:hypothetical protein L209DRAFT_14535 [Thermothelomyces heterothallicus CBS 203.75]